MDIDDELFCLHFWVIFWLENSVMAHGEVINAQYLDHRFLGH